MEQTLSDYVFWYCPLDKNCLQWTGRDFTAIFSLLWPKKGYFWHQRHKILNFEIENMVKNGANSLRLCVLILPFRWNRLQWTGRTFTAILGFYSHKKGYFWHQRHNILNFWNKKHGQKWSTLYQTMCIDTALQIKIVYSGLVVILRQFLAFHGSKKAIFATRGTKYSILKQKTWPKMEHTLPDYVFWYWPSNKTRLQWICHNFMAIFSFLWSKNATFATSGTKYSILKQ